MTDIVDSETRSRMMAAVSREDTAPELALRKALWVAGIRGYRLHRSDLPGTPDLAWIGKKVAVFVDGAFWHGHPRAFTPGKSGKFWDEKICRNQERDKKVDKQLKEMGWTVIRIWDFEIEENVESCVEAVGTALSD